MTKTTVQELRQPANMSPAQLLSGKRLYHAPEYQRLYTWDKSKLERFLDDAWGASDQLPNFIGPMVLQSYPHSAGDSYLEEQFMIVDGQQRLTTIYIILLAVARIASMSQDDEAKIWTDDFIVNEYLKLPTSAGKWKAHPKVIPTYQDRKDFIGAIKDATTGDDWTFTSFDKPTETLDVKIASQMYNAVELLRNKLLDEEGVFNKDQAEILVDRLMNRLFSVVITLDPHHNAGEIFRVLNAEGQPLSLNDLARNEIMLKVNADEMKGFYEEKFSPFESEFLNTAGLETFCSDTKKTKKIEKGDATLDRYYYHYGHMNSLPITRSNGLDVLRSHWDPLTHNEIISDLMLKRDMFLFMHHRNYTYERLGLKKKVFESLNRFREIEPPSIAIPFVVNLCLATTNKVTDSVSESDCLSCMKLIERFFVRRAMAGWAASGLHVIFSKLWRASKTKQNFGDPDKVFNALITNDVQVPSNESLAKLYTSSIPLKAARIILRRYEHSLRKKSDPCTVTTWSVEHLMPQTNNQWLDEEVASWGKDKVLPESYTSAAARSILKEYIDTSAIPLLGNLSLLTDSMNSSISNKVWSEKKKDLKKSSYHHSKSVAEKNSKWTYSSIRDRTKTLVDFALREWPELDS